MLLQSAFTDCRFAAQGWIVVIKRFQRARTRNQYAVEHAAVLAKTWALRGFVRGCIVLKRERLARERAMRKALEFLVDLKIQRARRCLNGLRRYADARIEKRKRRARLLRKAFLMWTNRISHAVLNRYVVVFEID